MLWPLPVVMVTSQGVDSPPNIITVAWTGIVCTKPPQLSISITPARHSYELIRQTGEFVVNIPAENILRSVDLCGVISGREYYKFAKARLTAIPAAKVRPPLISECPLSLECRVVKTIALGSHVMFIAEILQVHADSALVAPDGRLELEKARLISYCHGHYYTLGRMLGHFGFSVKRASKASRPVSAKSKIAVKKLPAPEK